MKCSVKTCKNVAAEGRKMCQKCCDQTRIYTKARHARYKARGGCLFCGSPAVNATRCKICTLKGIARKNLGNGRQAKAIGLLLHQQGHRCAYSGVRLHLGVNASIDHIIPKSKGGTHDLSNLQWVDTGVNRLRKDMDHEAFKVYLRQLAESVLSKELLF